jgi:hypothetical protein
MAVDYHHAVGGRGDDLRDLRSGKLELADAALQRAGVLPKPPVLLGELQPTG